ncbi:MULTISPECIES: hypothetical protein [Pseudomonadota]|jgi:hypothetical protein|uniref:Secreted protein n=1 Tax=Rhodanobacter glycinis TaxID=582702 RepID=A0A1I4BQQ1_9GAMM|nr:MULTISPECIES: hypothetical protein [Pseudomonadota]EIL97076.1 hypothetical protein UU5_05888 [Rhodanobacter sp. 115]TAN24981.1 MAG: hypothetical protein EPN31_16335 [Castellaniella sp.]SFK70527.1 hypothetical protein SAMN05192579_105198 [Rhodanobacter glycinis]
MTYRPALALSLLLAASLPLHAQQTNTLRQQMGATAYQRAGLDKLNAGERDYLATWLSTHASELAAAVPASAAPTATAATHAAPAHATVESHIAGHFNGWQPGAVLVLANGQRWRVADDSSLNTGRTLDAPAVTIKPGLLGGWLLKVKGYNTSARVQPAN